jgi:hypothetical protein
MIDALVTAGVWAKLDALYMLAAADAAAALTNLKSSSFGITAVNSPTFTADQGYTGASAKYLDTNCNPSTSGGQLAQNDACAFAWSLTSGPGIAAGSLGSSASSGARIVINPRYSDDHFYHNMNGTFNDSGSSSDGSGLRGLSRSASGSYTPYSNGSALTDITNTSLGLLDANILLLTDVTSYYDGGTVAAAGFGAALDATQHAALYSALHAYLQTVAGVA